MTDRDAPTPTSTSTRSPVKDGGAGWFGTRQTRALAAVAVVAGIAWGAQAVADSRPAQHLRLFVAEGGMDNVVPVQFGPGHGRHGRGSPFAGMSEGEREKMIARVVAHAAIELEASDEQRDEVTAILTELAAALQPVPDGFRDAGTRMRELLLADEVDAAALEAVRTERITEADRVSGEIVAAMVRVANVLTPEQRQTAAERIESFRAMRERFRRD